MEQICWFQAFAAACLLMASEQLQRAASSSTVSKVFALLGIEASAKAQVKSRPTFAD